MKLNWILICVGNELTEDGYNNVLHVCAYENEPTSAEEQSLREELLVDEEFDMVGREDYEIVRASRENDPGIFEMLGIPDEMPD